ncbi:17739_t:CDS:2 [Entrophospora sp. SA101]|nr:17739_t:CDS:2 [Entrophospora sp. SA101]CAJ0908840.1 2851_t:CDS:2 [Entrophospora sp. SA101]
MESGSEGSSSERFQITAGSNRYSSASRVSVREYSEYPDEIETL